MPRLPKLLLLALPLCAHAASHRSGDFDFSGETPPPRGARRVDVSKPADLNAKMNDRLQEALKNRPAGAASDEGRGGTGAAARCNKGKDASAPSRT